MTVVMGLALGHAVLLKEEVRKVSLVELDPTSNSLQLKA